MARSRDARDGRPPPRPRPEAYRDETTTWYEGARARLDPDTGETIDADVLAFLQDWRGGLSPEELARAWQYKPLVLSTVAKTIRDDVRRYKVKQIYVYNNRYRVILSIDDRLESPCIYFIALFKKQKDRQDNDVGLAVRHARQFWEDRDDAPS